MTICERLEQDCGLPNLKMCAAMAFEPTPSNKNPRTDTKQPRGMTPGGAPLYFCPPPHARARIGRSYLLENRPARSSHLQKWKGGRFARLFRAFYPN